MKRYFLKKKVSSRHHFSIMGILMMMTISLSFISCSDDEPECLEAIIMQFQSNQTNCPMASIKKYNFEGQVLFGFTDGNCIADGGTILRDESCEQFCFIGGIAGFTECNGVNFQQNAELVETIWESN